MIFDVALIPIKLIMLSQCLVMLCIISMACGDGYLLLYRPKDITNECAFSRHLRFDISYGMGMSDTITLVFRTLNDIDYECVVEVVTSYPQYLLAVIRYPTTLASNCAVNRDALTVLKKWRCLRICDLLDQEVYSPYFIFTVKERLRFLFKSNSSINSDINGNFYQVTVTSARMTPLDGCNRKNESTCTVNNVNYCFTTGVVCDGIKNCGVDDWFDERKARCMLPVDRLGYAPVIAVVAALLCAFIACGNALWRCLPSRTQSFFIFNANEDNRLCIDPVLVPQGVPPHIEPLKRKSIIPVFDSLSSACETINESQEIEQQDIIKNDKNQQEKEVNIELKEIPEEPIDKHEPQTLSESTIKDKPDSTRQSLFKNMKKSFQDKFKCMTNNATSSSKSRRKAKRVYDA